MLLFVTLSCVAQDNVPVYSNNVLVVGYREKTLQDTIMQEWQHKDILVDTVPGVSSEKAYKNLESTSGNTVIVAVIDTGIDIDHEDLKDQIWINTDEIPNNNKDDDNNGYIDDIHGWNFLGNPKGENTHYARKEFVKILKDKGFFNKKGELKIIDNETDSIILKALGYYKREKTVLQEDNAYVLEQKKEYENINNKLKNYFPNQNYNLDKLKTIDTLANPDLKASVKKLHEFLKYELTQEWLKDFEEYNDMVVNYKLNPNYDDQKVSGDDKSDLKDKDYGNNNVIGDKSIDTHGTSVAGLIGASRDNEKGIKGIANNVKLMVLRAVPQGDEYDKDIALAIRYAVDNGAKVINMSFGKSFSMHEKLVSDAMAYATKNDVLMVHGAGNDSNNIDDINFYPKDYYDNGDEEFTQNFINVGAIHYKLNRKFPAYFSNYGKKNVDIFAPGYNLRTTAPNNSYIYESGTSLAAPIVSGVAALIRSRFPNLKASQVKHILMNSGYSYDIQVTIPGKNKNEKTPFASLSKSGKVVNAYKALLMAAQMSSLEKTN